MSDFDQEWLSGHDGTAFPMREQVDIATNPLDQRFLVDLRLFLSGYTEVDVYMSRVVYDDTADTYELSFSLKSTEVVVLQGTVPRLNLDGSSRVFKKQHIAQGLKVGLFTPGSAWDDPAWGGVNGWTQNFLWEDAAVEATQVIPGPQCLQRVFIDGETIPPVSDWPRNTVTKLIAGYNLDFSRGNSRIPISPGQNIALADLTDLNCAPGLGQGFPPGGGAGPLGYVATFNHKGVSDSGALVIALQDCLRIFQPQSGDQPIPNTLMLASDCIPCCPCSEYRKVVRAEGRRSAKIKDMCDEIAQLLTDSATVYNDAVAIINAKRPPMAIVRNIRLQGSHVQFTVANTSSTPIYAYVAFNTVSSLHAIGAPAIAGGQSHVTLVDQTGTPDVYAAVNPHRLTVLPPLVFDPAENPLAGFPMTHFSPEAGDLLLAIGQRTANLPFAPIPPGATVEVLVSFPDVETAILSVPNPSTPVGINEVINASLPMQLPRFKFRSIGVYGASHSYPCAGETYEVIVETVVPDQDIIKSLCAVRLDGRFQVTAIQAP